MRRIQKKLILCVTSFCLILAFQNCGQVLSPQKKSQSDLSSYVGTPGYEQIDDAIITPHCLSCHSSGGADFSSYNALMNSGSVVAFDTAGSSFYTQVVSGRMPKGLSKLSSAEQQLIQKWIEAGAPEFGSSE